MKTDLSDYAKLNDATQNITAYSMTATPGSGYIHTTYGSSNISISIPRTPGYTLAIPTKDGTLATTDDIPTIVANPAETSTANLTAIQIGSTVYDIPGGSSGTEHQFGSIDADAIDIYGTDPISAEKQAILEGYPLTGIWFNKKLYLLDSYTEQDSLMTTILYKNGTSVITYDLSTKKLSIN